MESKTEIMVCLATAVGANCIPCFDHLYAKAREAGLSDDEVRDTVALARKVRSGAGLFFARAVADVLGDTPEGGTPCCATETATCC